MTIPGMQSGASPVGWGEPQPYPEVVDSAGHRLAADVLAARVLDGTITHFALAGQDLPTRRFVAPGAPREVAWDCEQVTVACAGLGWGPAGNVGEAMDAQQLSTMVRHLVLEVSVTRKLPPRVQTEHTTGLPNEADLNAAGMTVLRDVGILSQAIAEMFGPAPADRIVPVGTQAQPGVVEVLGPMGEYVAVATTITVTLGALA